MKCKGLFVFLILLAVPLPGRGDEPKKSVGHEVPYRLSDTKHVVVRTKINGKGPFNLVVDTGAPALYLTRTAGRKLGVEADKEGWVNFERFELEGGLVIPKAKGRLEDIFQIEGMNGMGVVGVELHGLMGYNLLAQYLIEYDFTRDKMIWTRLDFVPEAPQRMGKGGAPPMLDAMGTVMKTLGAFMGKTAEHEVAARGFLGLEVAERDGGIHVKAVLANGPAAKAGIKVGDRITQVQDRDIDSGTDFHKATRKIKADDTVTFVVRRNNEAKEITFTAGKGL